MLVYLLADYTQPGGDCHIKIRELCRTGTLFDQDDLREHSVVDHGIAERFDHRRGRGLSCVNELLISFLSESKKPRVLLYRHTHHRRQRRQMLSLTLGYFCGQTVESCSNKDIGPFLCPNLSVIRAAGRTC